MPVLRASLGTQLEALNNQLRVVSVYQWSDPDQTRQVLIQAHALWIMDGIVKALEETIVETKILSAMLEAIASTKKK